VGWRNTLDQGVLWLGSETFNFRSSLCDCSMYIHTRLKFKDTSCIRGTIGNSVLRTYPSFRVLCDTWGSCVSTLSSSIAFLCVTTHTHLEFLYFHKSRHKCKKEGFLVFSYDSYVEKATRINTDGMMESRNHKTLAAHRLEEHFRSGGICVVVNMYSDY
jgi:hypothetical protein